jgi:hypothetical protein
MTPEEETAYHRGKQAAVIDARPHQQSERIFNTYRRADLRRAWNAGYNAQNSTPSQALTPEQEAKRAGFIDAVKQWLDQNK